MNEKTTENLAKLCQKADQPAEVTETAVATTPSTTAANGRPARLKPSQERALVALLECRSIAAAARQAQVGDRTLRRWLHEDVCFQTRLRQLSQESLAHATQRLHDGASGAVHMTFVLIESSERIESPRVTRVRTSRKASGRAGYHRDLRRRVTALEAAFKQTRE